MSKRAPQFERNERDFYPTPAEAVLPLKPYLHQTFEFYEPCAGDGALAIALKGQLGLHCVGMSDIEPRTRAVDRLDALKLTETFIGDADYLITNPPWERTILHKLINHLKWLRPTWLLLDADWLFTGQAAEYIADATHIVPIGRLKWVPGTAHKGKDNCCWVCFVGGHDDGPKFPPELVGGEALMQYLFLDLETYYTTDYSLKKMTPLEYTLDPRFEAIGCGFVDGGGSKVWVDGPDLPDFFADVDWRNTYAISHNALFDMVVLSFRYGHVPAMYGDTMSMARNQLAHKLRSVSLEKVSEYYGMPAKHTGTLAAMKDVSFEMLRQNPELHAAERIYGMDDASKCREIFGRLIAGGFPPSELDIVDMVVRMAAAPQLELDPLVLSEHLAQVQADKALLLAEAGIAGDDKSSIMSDQQLSIKLWWLGVKELPRKVSKTTGKEAFAFAKTDKQFTALLDHPNPRVQALVAARLGHKSTLEESRSERLISISRFTERAPVPLKYSGAHTHRFSGEWKINLQNLARGGRLRTALRAPKGKKVVSVDASQIEARFNAQLSGQDDLVEDFRNGIDVYSKFAGEDIYHYPVDKTMVAERFVGKTGILQLGYGSSFVPFQNMCRVKSDPRFPVNLKDNEAAEIVQIYRRRFSKIVANWRYADNVVLPAIGYGPTLASALGLDDSPEDGFMWGPLNVRKGRIVLPNGNCLYYNDLHRDTNPQGRPGWVFKRADMPINVYGAKIVENVIQALAFVHIMEVARRIWEMSGRVLYPAHQVHDELLYVVDERIADQVAAIAKREMSVSPAWMPNVPLAAEAAIGDSYGGLGK